MKAPETEAQVGDEMHFTSGLPFSEIEVGTVVEVLSGPTRWCVATPDSPGIIVEEWQVVEVRAAEEPTSQCWDRDAAGVPDAW